MSVSYADPIVGANKLALISKVNLSRIQTLFFDDFSSPHISWHSNDFGSGAIGDARAGFIRHYRSFGMGGGSKGCLQMYAGDNGNALQDAKRGVPQYGYAIVGAECWFQFFHHVVNDGSLKFAMTIEQQKLGDASEHKGSVAVNPANSLAFYENPDLTWVSLATVQGMPEIKHGTWNYMNLELDYSTNKYLTLKVNEIDYSATVAAINILAHAGVPQSTNLEFHLIGGGASGKRGGEFFIGAAHLYAIKKAS